MYWDTPPFKGLIAPTLFSTVDQNRKWLDICSQNLSDCLSVDELSTPFLLTLRRDTCSSSLSEPLLENAPTLSDLEIKQSAWWLYALVGLCEPPPPLTDPTLCEPGLLLTLDTGELLTLLSAVSTSLFTGFSLSFLVPCLRLSIF